MAASGLQAMCDGCGQRVEVEDLFSFDCTCPDCGGALAIEDEVGFADEAPPPPPAPRDIEEEELFSDRPTKSDTLLPAAPLHDLPTKADTEDDPYALAAQALDSSVSTSSARSGATSRHVTSRRTTQAITTYSEEDLAAPPAPGGALSSSGVALLPGTPTDAPPLPSWDDTASKLHPPPPAAGDLDGLVEVFEVPAGGTAGRGSRTYEREEVLAQAGPGGELEVGSAAGGASPAAPSAPTTSTDAFERGATTRVGRPPGALFGDQDLDWLALIDDNLPESDAADGDSKPRVVIRLPETAAPTDAADSEQVKQFEQAIKSLEAGGPGAIDSLLSGTAALSDTRKARRFRGDSTQPLATGQAATQPLKKPEEDTKGWEVDPAQSPLPARPPSGRTEPVKPRAGGGGPKTVDSFRHEDLDAALVCARDASSPDSDRFRQLVQRIFHPNEGQAPRIVMVTSPRPGDGKTTVAANLAIAAAGRLPGRGAVLVDADPRGRGLLRSFGMFTRTEGLLEALRGGEGVSQDPRDHVLQFSLGALDVVPLGIPGSDAAELLASERMGTFLNRLKDGYPNAVIIVDASAVLHAADPLVLARSVDGVVLVARADRTARDDVRRAIEMLGPKRLLGLVLNDAAA